VPAAVTAAVAAAFFDVDHTILRVNSGSEWIRHQVRRGELGPTSLLRGLWWAALYHVALLDMEKLATRLAAGEKGGSVAVMTEVCDRWWKTEIERHVTDGARQALRHHRQRGELTALLTSGTQFLAEPMARDLGVDAALCSRLEHQDGCFTGRFTAPLCFGKGKIRWAEDWARQHHVDLDRSTFYSDSWNDLPMLERVGTPVVVNPDLRLRLHARRRGWRIASWR
jgi:HAD superfamily hydrolase (TIGR01490 family)